MYLVRLSIRAMILVLGMKIIVVGAQSLLDGIPLFITGVLLFALALYPTLYKILKEMEK